MSGIIKPAGYVEPGKGVDKRSGEELEVDPSAPRALTLNAVREQLAAVARKIGETYGVKLSVALQGSTLYFVDEVGDRVVDRAGDREPEEVICCTELEIGDGMFLRLFAGRAMWAAVIERMNMASRGDA